MARLVDFVINHVSAALEVKIYAQVVIKIAPYLYFLKTNVWLVVQTVRRMLLEFANLVNHLVLLAVVQPEIV